MASRDANTHSDSSPPLASPNPQQQDLSLPPHAAAPIHLVIPAQATISVTSTDSRTPPAAPTPTVTGADTAPGQPQRVRIPVLVDLIPTPDGRSVIVTPPYVESGEARVEAGAVADLNGWNIGRYTFVPTIAPYPTTNSAEATPQNTTPPSQPADTHPSSPPPPSVPRANILGFSFLPVFFGPPQNGADQHSHASAPAEGQNGEHAGEPEAARAGSGDGSRERVNMEEGQRRPGVEQGRGGDVGDMMDVDGSDDVEQVSGGDTSVSSSTTTSTADPPVTDPIIPASPLNTPTTLGTTPATPQTRPASSHPPWLPPSSFTFPFVPLSPTSGLLYDPTTGTVYHISFPSPTGGGGAPTTTAQPRASPSAIASLPPITYISPTTLALHPHCPVCLEAFRRGDQTLAGPHAVVALPCKHVFHRACAEQWLERSNACPVCRWELPTGDAGYDVGVEERNGKRVEEWRRAHTAGTGTGVEAPVEAGAGGDGGVKGVPTGTKEIGWADLTLETVAAPTRGPLESIPSPDTSPTSTSSLQRSAFASRLPSIRIRAAPSCALERLGTCSELPSASSSSSDEGSDTMDALPPAPTLYLPGCSHRFHTFCLSRSVRVRGWEDEAKLVEKGELDGVVVRCPVCRRAGTVEMVEEGSEEQGGVWEGVGWAEAA